MALAPSSDQIVTTCKLLHTFTFATLSATLYFWPSFSSSAITHSVMQGMHSAYRQSIMPRTRSIWGEGAVDVLGVHQGVCRSCVQGWKRCF